ncbi:uncharacterized protein [Henckelia pumila]|uniref:uncharacterized protein n=1 Tax=Henckelia pumila TaxID=405737 RepID=UPI003C6DDAC9
MILAEQQGLLQPPRPMNENPKRQRSEKYCSFYKDKGHTTEECFNLRAEIERAIKRGYLADYVDKSRNTSGLRKLSRDHSYGEFQKMGISNTQLMQVKTPLASFEGEKVEAAEELTLPLYLGLYPQRATKMVKFSVFKAPSPYNVILERPILNLFQAIASTYHMKLKFQIFDGIDELDYDKDGKNIQLVLGESEEKERMKATETLKYIEIVQEHQKKILKIGSNFPAKEEKALTNFLQHNVDVFDWGDEALPGCKLLSFFDVYQGYNQIYLAHNDQEKSSFITDRGIYCYDVMPFGLKNAEATYQRCE